MEKVTLDPAIKFGAGRYRQERIYLKSVEKKFHVLEREHLSLPETERGMQ